MWQGVLMFCTAVFLVRKLCNIKARTLGNSATLISTFSNQNSYLLKEEIGLFDKAPFPETALNGINYI